MTRLKPTLSFSVAVGLVCFAGQAQRGQAGGGSSAAGSGQDEPRPIVLVAEPGLVRTVAEGRAAVEQQHWLPMDLRSPEAFAAGHLPGARSASLFRDPGPSDLAALRSDLGRLGFSGSEPVLLYGDAGDALLLGRAFWWLERAGFERVAVLDGGVDDWVRVGGLLQREVTPVSARDLLAPPRLEVEVGLEELQRSYGLPGFEVLDLRDAGPWMSEDYRAPPSWGAGHVPYALPYDFRPWVVEGWPTVEACRSALGELGPRHGASVDLGAEFLLYADGPDDPQLGLAYLLLRRMGVLARVFTGGFRAWSAGTNTPIVHIVLPNQVAERLAHALETDLLPPLVIDLRERRDFTRLHVPSALNLPWYRLTRMVDQALASERPGAPRAGLQPIFYCYGRECIRSREASVWAARNGFLDIGWLREGLEGWPEDRLALVGTARPESQDRHGDGERTGVAVSGWVEDGAGQPVAGAQVALVPESGDDEGAEALTEADGRFVLTGLAAGEYALGASKEDYFSEVSATRLVVGDLDLDDLRIRLGRGLTLRGRLLGLEEQDLPLVQVLAHGQPETRPGAVGTSGDYQVTGLAPGYWRVKALVPGSGRQAEGFITLEKGQADAELDLDLKQGHLLTGRVEHHGQPLAGALVAIFSYALGLSNYTETAGDGTFRLDNLASSSYELKVAAPGRGLSHTEELVVDADREIVLQLAGSALVGRVASEVDAQPIARASLRLERLGLPRSLGAGELPRLASTDSGGYFRFPELPDGSYRLTAAAPAHAARVEEIEISASTNEQVRELALSANQGLTLGVALESGDTPRQVTAAVMGLDGQPLLVGSFVLDTPGRLELSSVPEGTWDLLLLQVGGSALRALRAQAPGDLGTVVLARGGAVSVAVAELAGDGTPAGATLVGPNGQPLLRLDAGGRIGSLVSLERGHARLDSVPAGSWAVEVVTADGRRWRWQAEVVAGAVTLLAAP